MSETVVSLRFKQDGSVEVINATKQVQQAVAGVGQAAQATGGTATANFNQVGQAAQNAGQTARAAGNQVGGALNQLSSAASRLKALFQDVGALVGVFGAASAIRGTLRLADAYANMQARIKLVIEDSSQLGEVTDEVFEISQRTFTSLNATANLVARTTRALISNGESAGQALQLSLRLTETIQQAFAVSGATTAETTNSIIQLSQGLAAGALRGEEFNSVAEQAPRILQAIADSLGVTTGQLRALAFEGKLTTDIVKTALLEQSGVIATEFAKVPLTLERSFTLFLNALERYIGETDQSILATRALTDVVVILAENLDIVLNTVILVSGVLLTRYVASAAAAALATVRLTAAASSAAAAMGITAAASTGLGAALLRLVGGPVGAVVLTLGAVALGLNEVSRANEEAAAKFDQINEKTNQSAANLRDLSDAIDTLAAGPISLAETLDTSTQATNNLVAAQAALAAKRKEIQEIEEQIAQSTFRRGQSLSLRPNLEEARAEYDLLAASVRGLTDALSPAVDELNQRFAPALDRVRQGLQELASAGNLPGVFRALSSTFRDVRTEIDNITDADKKASALFAEIKKNAGEAEEELGKAGKTSDQVAQSLVDLALKTAESAGWNEQQIALLRQSGDQYVRLEKQINDAKDATRLANEADAERNRLLREQQQINGRNEAQRDSELLKDEEERLAALRAAEEQQQAFDERARDLEQEIALLSASSAEREQLAIRLDAENLARDKNGNIVESQITRYEKLLTKLAETRRVNAAAAAFESIWTSAVDSVSDAIGAFVSGELDSFEDFADSIVDTFQNMIGQLIAEFAKSGLLDLVSSVFGIGQGGNTSSLISGLGNFLGNGSLAEILGAGIQGAGIGALLGGNLFGGSRQNTTGGSLGGAAGGIFASTTFGAGLIGSGLSAIGLGASLGSVVPVVGTVIGAILGAALGNLFEDDPRLRVGGGSVVAGRSTRRTFDTALGTVGFFDTEEQSNKWLDQLRDAFIQFDQTIAGFVSSDQLEAIRTALSTTNFRYDNREINPETIFNDRFNVILSTFSENVQEYVGTLGTLDERVQRLADGSFIELAAESGDLISDFTTLADVLGEFRREGESISDTYNRLLVSTVLLEEALALAGQSLGLTREEFVQFAGEVADQAGGVERLQSLFRGYFEFFYDQEELAQQALGRARGDATQRFDAIGLDLDQFTGEGGADAFRQIFEEIMPTLSAEALVLWLEAANSLGILLTAQEQYNDLIDETTDNTAENAERLAAFMQRIQESADATAIELAEFSLSPLQRELNAIERQTAANITAARALGATEEQLAVIRAEGNAQAELARLNAATELEELLGGLRFDASLIGLSEYDRQVAEINRRFEGYIAQAIALGASEEQLTEIRAIQQQQIDALVDSTGDANDGLSRLNSTIQQISAGQAVSAGDVRDLLDILAEARVSVRGDGLTDQQRAINSINARFDQLISDAAARLPAAQIADDISRQTNDPANRVSQIQAIIAELDQLRVEAINRAIADGEGDLENSIRRRYEMEIDFVERLIELRNDLLLDDNLSPLTPAEQLAEAERLYLAQVAAIEAAAATTTIEDDIAARAGFEQTARTYLDLLREFEGSSQVYTDGFNNVLATIDRFIDQFDIEDPDGQDAAAVVVEAALNRVAEGQDAQTDALVESIDQLKQEVIRLRQVNEQQESQIRNLRDALTVRNL